jgi:hypothetical protein
MSDMIDVLSDKVAAYYERQNFFEETSLSDEGLPTLLTEREQETLIEQVIESMLMGLIEGIDFNDPDGVLEDDVIAVTQEYLEKATAAKVAYALTMLAVSGDIVPGRVNGEWVLIPKENLEKLLELYDD